MTALKPIANNNFSEYLYVTKINSKSHECTLKSTMPLISNTNNLSSEKNLKKIHMNYPSQIHVIISEGKNIVTAIELGLNKLAAKKEDVLIEVIQTDNQGLTNALVKITRKLALQTFQGKFNSVIFPQSTKYVSIYKKILHSASSKPTFSQYV
jgi:hypothetical protein